jgi:hypothetical protein
MPLNRWQSLAVVFIAIQALASAQAPFSWAAVAQPPVPRDPLEMAGNAQPVQDVAQRTAAINLLETARDRSNVRGGPYDLKLQFTSTGSLPLDGNWQLEDMSPGRNIYRWTVRGPSYSAVNLFLRRVLYSNQPAAGMPLRLAQVRGALFANYPVYGPLESIRTLNGNLKGADVTCVLVSHQVNAKPASGPRRWEEYESCIDPKSGLLISYSPAPGLYVLYDYSSAQHFNDKVFPGKFTITQSGQTVIEARVESLGDVANIDASVFKPAGLTPLGTGRLITPPWTFHSMAFAGKPGANPGAQFVVLHGMISADGHFAHPEVLASSNASLNQQALQRLTLLQNWQSLDTGQSSATPQPHEIFFTTLFLVTEPRR